MKTIAVITIPFIVYFGLGWLAKDIYFYFNEITGYTTMKEIYNGEIIAASILCVTYNTLCEIIGKESLVSTILCALPIVLAFIFVVLPMSTTAAVINSIISLALMIMAGVVSFKS